MKNLFKYFILVLFAACSANLDPNNLKVVTFDTSIHCENCVNTMLDNLPKEAGVVDLKVELNEKLVTLVFNSEETTVEKLAEKINELGYSAYVKSINEFKKN
ncbi:MAG: heavy-metal-associated domain-containing protein [Ignavibacteriae bacterium]|nr:heavy-metal-associated domain-containing protein [Ignavibacteriota bacterium]